MSKQPQHILIIAMELLMFSQATSDENYVLSFQKNLLYNLYTSQTTLSCLHVPSLIIKILIFYLAIRCHKWIAHINAWLLSACWAIKVPKFQIIYTYKGV